MTDLNTRDVFPTSLYSSCNELIYNVMPFQDYIADCGEPYANHKKADVYKNQWWPIFCKVYKAYTPILFRHFVC